MALLEYKCPCCAGKLEFDSALQKVKCPFCESEFEMSVFQQLDEALDSQVEENLDWQTSTVDTWGVDEGMKAYSCQSCGAQIVMDETTAASKCPYCDNPIVMITARTMIISAFMILMIFNLFSIRQNLPYIKSAASKSVP